MICVCVCVLLSSVCFHRVDPIHRLVNPYRTTRYVFQSLFETSACNNDAGRERGLQEMLRLCPRTCRKIVI